MKTRLLGSRSDETLLELAQLGSRAAFEALVNRHSRSLLRHCRQLCLSEESAQEALRRTLSEAWSGLGGEPRLDELRPWLHRIAERMAAYAMCAPGSSPAVGCDSPAAEAALGLQRSRSDGAPRPDEVLALRGALAAISPARGDSEVLVHRTDGNKTEVLVEDVFEIADNAVHGLIGRVRKGISALTPPPLLAWALGRAAQDSGGGGERIAELGAGGAAGLTGLAVKGGIAALSAGVLITGAVIAQSRHSHGSGASPRSAPTTEGRAVADARRPVSAATVSLRGAGVESAAALRRHRSDSRRSRALSRPSAVLGPRSTQATPAPASGAPSAAKGAPSSSYIAPPHAGSAGQQPSAGASQATGGEGSSEGAAGSSGGSGQPSGAGGGSASRGGGIGVQVSVETGSGQQTSTGAGASSSGSTSGESQTQGAGVGISVSLEPLGSVGVHVSLP
jgi:DNA-directed RNA polymerase specialized sigma24 family protein